MTAPVTHPAVASISCRAKVSVYVDQGPFPVGAISINGRTAIVLRDPQKLQDRATITAERLNFAVANGISAKTASARRNIGSEWVVTLGGSRLVTATAGEAKAHAMTSEALALAWSRSVRQLLISAPITVSSDSILLPNSETRDVLVTGTTAPSDISVTNSDMNTVVATFDPTTRLISLRGISDGQAVVTVSGVKDPTESLSIKAVVMDYAAHIEPTESIVVTGTPTPPSILTNAVWVSIAKAIQMEPTASLDVELSQPDSTPLPLGSQRQVGAVVKVAGVNLIGVADKLHITIQNEDVSSRPAATLFYSNNPEQIRGDMRLFAGSLQPFEPARLVFHHQNSTSQNLVLHIDLENMSGRNAEANAVYGVATPGADPVQVGHRAGFDFLANLQDMSGFNIEAPSSTVTPLLIQRVTAGNTASGIIQLQQLTGLRNALRVKVYTTVEADQSVPIVAAVHAAIGGQALAAYGSHAINVEDDLGRDSPYIFVTPDITQHYTYTVGQNWTYIHLGGSDSLVNHMSRQVLFGNYGVLYHMEILATNPTNEARVVGIYFAAEAGDAAGVFRVDGGPLIDMDPFDQSDERPISTFVVAPSASKSVDIESMPLSGSAYPASIVVHAL